MEPLKFRRSLLVWVCCLGLVLPRMGHFIMGQELEGFEDERDESIEAPEVAEVTYGSADGGNQDVDVEKGFGSDDGSLWDEDEFEGIPRQKASPPTGIKKIVPQKSKPVPPRTVFQRQEHYYYEALAGCLLVLYAINVFIGKQKNEGIALAWAHAFVSEGAVLERNFSLLGAGDGEDGEVLMKESQSVFKFYASGRRYCHGMLATIDLRARQDLLSMLMYLVSPREDKLEVEVYMHPSNMPSIVMACATQRLIRTLIKDNLDLKTYSKEIPVKQISDWPGNKLAVHTESSEIFYDIFTAEVRALFTGQELETTLKYFRFLHFSSEYQGSTHRCMLRFTFALPSRTRMEEDLGKLMNLIPLFIDLVGAYKLSPEAKKRAEKIRAEETQRIWKEGETSRREALQQKKREEYEAEMERIKKLPLSEQQKWVEKQQKVKQRRSVKVKMVRA